MSASTVGEARKINVLVVGDSPRLFSSFRRLEKLGCECHFAESHREVSALLRVTLSSTSYSACTRTKGYLNLGGLRGSMFYMLPVEQGCWWLPVLRNGENCLGTPAIRTTEFTYVLIEIIKGIATDAASRRPSVV